MNLAAIIASPRAFPTVVIALQIAASVRYSTVHNWPQATYWLLGAALNAVCAYWMK